MAEDGGDWAPWKPVHRHRAEEAPRERKREPKALKGFNVYGLGEWGLGF